MRHLLLAVPCLFAVASPRAQITPSAVPQQGIVRAGTVVASAWPVGLEAWPGLVRQATGVAGGASLAVDHGLAADRVVMHWHLAAAAVAAGSCEARLVLRYELMPAAAGPAWLDIAWQAQGSGSGAADVLVDVHGDGVLDAVGTTTVPVVLGAAPLVVVVSASATASAGVVQGPFGSSWSWSGNAVADLALALRPAHASVQQVGSACGASPPDLVAGPDFAGGVTFAASGAGGADLTLLVLGLTPAALPLPSSPCTLRSDALLVLAQVPAGPGTWHVDVPPAARPLALFAERVGLVVAPWTPTTSAAWRLDVP